jgi:hypothetical protein
MQSSWKRFFLVAAAVAFGLTASIVPAQAPDPGMGTWNLNLAKSKYNPGPAHKSVMTKFEPAGNGVKNTTEFVGGDGRKGVATYVASYDGKDAPIKGSPLADSVSLMRKDAATIVRTDKKDGKVVQTMTRVVAKDGKSMTVEIKGKNAKGEPFDNLLWFDKQ